MSLLILQTQAQPTQLSPSEIELSIKATGNPATATSIPPLYTAKAFTTCALTTTSSTTTADLEFQILQGQPSVLSLQLDGAADILSVSGDQLLSCSIRQSPNTSKRHLDLRFKSGTSNQTARVILRQSFDDSIGTIQLPTFGPSDAIGFSQRISVATKAPLFMIITGHQGLDPLTPTEKPTTTATLQGSQDARLLLRLIRDAAKPDVQNATLSGTVIPTKNAVELRLQAELLIQPSTRETIVELLSGDAAPIKTPSISSAFLRLHNGCYRLHLPPSAAFRRLPLDLAFDARILADGMQRSLNFRILGGSVIPLTLAGLDADTEFDRTRPVAPRWVDKTWTGHLPADGTCRLAWKVRKSDADKKGRRFFTSEATVELTVAPGLLQQRTDLTLQLLQGNLPGLSLSVAGTGDILNVTGPQIVGWERDGDRLTLETSRPIEGIATIRINSQTPIPDVPATVEPLRIIPTNAVRHAGTIRLSNRGAIRIGLTDQLGLTQLPPETFKGPPLPDNTRQTFVYRFPSATHRYRLTVDAVLPIVSVSQIVRHRVSATERVLTANLEFDIREAPIREWTVRIPNDYSVASVSGAAVADHQLDSDTRDLKLTFRTAVQGRQLVTLRLERTATVEPGRMDNWTLPLLKFPETKQVRGHIGVEAAPGYRIDTVRAIGVTELPVASFPIRSRNLQQAYRIREGLHAITVAIEPLRQHVDVDAFHLTSLKEGLAYGSVVFNYFVVGAPVSQWKLFVPAELGNLVIDGQHVRSWKREGETITVALRQPVLGAYTMLVTFEQELTSRRPQLATGLIRPLDVQGERGIVQVTCPRPVRHSWSEASSSNGNSGSLIKLDPLELPAEFQLMSRSPSLGIFQYSERPFNLQLDLEWLDADETIGQVVDVAELRSVLSRDGDVMTEARYFVKTRGRKTLRLTLPDGLQLWEARVAGDLVKPRRNNDETILPLPLRVDPNTAVDVALRFGNTSADPKHPRLIAPQLSPAILFARWQVKTEDDRVLLPGVGGTALSHPLPETGFAKLSSLATNHLALAGFGLLLLGLLFRLVKHPAIRTLSGLAIFAATLAFAWLGFESWNRQAPVSNQLDLVTSMIGEGQAFEFSARHMDPLTAQIHPFGLALVAAGIFCLLAAFRWRWLLLPAITAMGCGILSQNGGLPWFCFALAALLLVVCMYCDFRSLLRWRANPIPAAHPTTLLLLLFGLISFPDSAQASDPIAADLLDQTAVIENGRLYSTINLQVSGKKGDHLTLLHPPAILAGFEGPGLSVEASENGLINLRLTTNGTVTATARYERPLPNVADLADLTDLSGGFALPTGPASVNRLDLSIPEGGWSFSSSAAVSTTKQEENERSAATFVFGASQPNHPIRIDIRPRARDLGKKAARIFADVSNVFVPGPGVIDSRHVVAIRPSKGTVSQLDLDMPEGFTVRLVTGPQGPIGLWRFDPTTRRLRVDLEPAQSSEFKLIVEAQRGTEPLPVSVKLYPLVVPDASGQIGTLALAFRNRARAISVKAEGLAPLHLKDVPNSHLPSQPPVTLHRAFRYSDENQDTPLEVNVGPVLPELRARWDQRLSLASDRTVLAADLTVDILKAGIFHLDLNLPPGFELESLTGQSLGQLTETKNRARIDLKGSTSGRQTFAMTLVSTGVTARAAWPVPRLSLAGTRRQNGMLRVLPETGIRLRPVARRNVAFYSSPDVQDGEQRFQLLQTDWSLTLDIDELDPWITAQALQEVAFREGRVSTRINLRFEIENAAVDSLRLILPALSEEEQASLRANLRAGNGLRGISKVAETEDEWRLSFRRRMIGTIPVTIEYHRRMSATSATPEPADQTEWFSLLQLPEVRQVDSFFALHTTGRLDLRPPNNLPPGWRPSDWTAVPPALRRAARDVTPSLTLRVSDPELPLPLQLVRDDVEDVLKLRVVGADILTAFSSQGQAVHSVTYQIMVIEKSSLPVRLPADARLFNAFVNGESVNVLRQDNDLRFPIVSNPFIDGPDGPDEPNGGLNGTDGPAELSFVYSVPSGSPSNPSETITSLALQSPRLPIPVENLQWRVVVPDGLRLIKQKGDLDLAASRPVSASNLRDYLAQLKEREARRGAIARDRLNAANQRLQLGQRDRAIRMLDNIALSKDLDSASNEDARVQLENVQTEQVWLGLNTRRQRLQLENSAYHSSHFEVESNERLLQARQKNPLFQGRFDYRPEELPGFLALNSAEENAALRRLAKRLASHQLAGTPAPQGIAIDLSRQGTLYEFTRRVNVDGSAPVGLHLSFAPAQTGHGKELRKLAMIATVATGLTLCGVLILLGIRREPGKAGTDQ